MFEDLSTVENTLVKTHTCGGRIERKFSEQLGHKFELYERAVTDFFEVGDLNYVHVLKLKFGFLEEGSELLEDLLGYEKSSLEIKSDNISFKSIFCIKDSVKFAIVTWDNQDHSCYYPKYLIYLRKKDVLNF